MWWSEAARAACRPACAFFGVPARSDVEQSPAGRRKLPACAAVGGGDDPPADRRRRGRLLAALALSGGLVACGFRLRGAQQLPFESLYIDAPPGSTFGIELARSIRTGTATKLVDRAAAQAVVEIVSEARERDVLSVNAQGRAREYRIVQRVVFRAHDGKGRELLPVTTLAASRDLAVSEAELLAREAEEVQLHLDMQIDLVQQLLRRLSVLKP
jgi:LPS-assembly lipoprotein